MLLINVCMFGRIWLLCKAPPSSEVLQGDRNPPFTLSYLRLLMFTEKKIPWFSLHMTHSTTAWKTVKKTCVCGRERDRDREVTLVWYSKKEWRQRREFCYHSSAFSIANPILNNPSKLKQQFLLYILSVWWGYFHINFVSLGPKTMPGT